MLGIEWDRLLTREALLAFILGSIFTAVILRLKGRLVVDMPKNKASGDVHFASRVRTIWVAWGIIVIIMLGIGWRQESFARDAIQCQREFNTALRARADASRQDQQGNVRSQEALQLWLFSLLNPPPEIKDLPQDDPARRDWGVKLTEEYLAKVDAIGKQRAATEEIRQRNPLPEPSCGSS